MRPTAAQVAALCFLALGCGSGKAKSLEGSLSVTMDLTYDSAELLTSDTEAALKFAQTLGSIENVVFQVTVNWVGVEVKPGVPIDLTELAPSGAQRGVVSRNVDNDPRHTFPPLGRGRLLLQGVPNSGGKTRGDFSVTFENGTHFASGRTVFGKFEASVP